MGKRGPLPGTGGRPSKALAEKLANGNPGHRPIKVMSLPDIPEFEGADMPKPRDYLKARQKNGTELEAAKIYEETWKWLKERGCEQHVSTQIISQYAMSVARWIQCEDAISEFGFLAKHPTTGAAITSPYVAMSTNYMKQINQQWAVIFSIVKENCSDLFDHDSMDPMEALLRSRLPK